MNRRNLFKIAAGSTGALLASKASAVGVCMEPTMPQTEGPFYPKDWTEYETDADMTKLVGSKELAKGQLTIISGQVIDVLSCEPIANAIVDVWQANIFGQYLHERDANKDEIKDKNFQYRCRIKTDADGRFSFKTIKPAPYPATQTWIRPPHIHYKVTTDKYEELITQMYFEGDPLNNLDRILQGMTKTQQDGVNVSFKENPSKVLEGDFTIALQPK
jgi:protocatechuate 3,4-dioxygenase beta subunit